MSLSTLLFLIAIIIGVAFLSRRNLKVHVFLMALLCAGIISSFVPLTIIPTPAQAAPPGKFQMRLDAPAAQLLSVERHGTDMQTVTLYGEGGRLAVIHADGAVDLYGDPNEAALVFWRAVGATVPACKEAK